MWPSKCFPAELRPTPNHAPCSTVASWPKPGWSGKLTHPHIVEIYDAGTENDLNYVVMEYVKGSNLEAHAEPQNLLPVGKVVEIIFKCVRALDMAMREGIIHRDIKPGNILLTDTGDIKISDFGAAVHARGAETTGTMEQTAEGIIGSPGYMSPEQVRNDTLTHQTDIYSLGVVMYRLLTGRLPFNASNQMGLAYAILNTDPPPPSSLRPNLPPVLDDIVMVAMAKERTTRYANWIEFGKDLTAGLWAVACCGRAGHRLGAVRSPARPAVFCRASAIPSCGKSFASPPGRSTRRAMC